MILMYPFEDKKERIRVSSHYELKNNILQMSYVIDDKDRKIEDLYPIDIDAGTGTVFPLENLWTTTCFEIFLKNRDNSNYYEFNFNSKGEWNLFYFSAYRQREKDLKITTEMKFFHSLMAERIQLNFYFDIRGLTNLKLPCQVNMAAVVKTGLGTTHWSQKHNGEKADFHDFNNFTLKL